MTRQPSRLLEPDAVVGPQLEVRGERDLSEFELNLLQQAELPVHGAEAWTVGGSNHDSGYSTHSMFRYFGKFPPAIAGHLIRTHTTQVDLVRDPTCGSGTTGVEGLLSGRRCDLADLNPLCTLVSRTKTRPIELNRLESAVERVRKRYQPLTSEDSDIEPVGLKNVEHWFLPETVCSLRGLRQAIDQESRVPEREFLLTNFASCVRRVSRATTQQGRQFLDVKTSLEDAWPIFDKNVRRSAEAVAALPRGDVSVSQSDVLVERKNIEPATLSIVHPPYFNAYRYSSINSFEMAWLGYSPAQVRGSEIREAFKTATREKVTAYVDDIETMLNSVCNSTMPNGTVALMIGDSVLRGEYLPIVRSVLNRTPAKLKLANIALRVPRHTEATWVSSQRRSGTDMGIKLYDFVFTFEVGH